MSRENSGKREHQKIKPYIVLEYLMKYSDEGHAISAKDIVDYLNGDCGIDAERRSIYRDIDEINKVLYMLENECTIDEAEEVIDSEDGEEEKFIVYDKNKKDFYVRQRKYDANDIRLLAECVYSARFIDEKRAKRLAKLTGNFVSQWQAEEILHDAFLVDRTKTTNTAVYYSVDTIQEAISLNRKIHFRYFDWGIDGQRRYREKSYEASPYGLCQDNENCYLLAYSPRHGVTSYRVDRMADIQLTELPRIPCPELTGKKLTEHANRLFQMYSGDATTVKLRFHRSLINVVIDRFGRDILLIPDGDEHFVFTVSVAVSPMFLSWVIGFGSKAKILFPQSVVDACRQMCRDAMDQYDAM